MKAAAEGLASVWLTEVDSRRYAAVRIALGVLVLLNIAHFWPLRVALFSNVGTVGGAASAELNPGLHLSVFSLAPSPLGVTLTFVCAAAAAALLTIGKWARPMAVAVAWFSLSTIQRAPLATGGWDFVLSNFALLLAFSPLGAEWRPADLWRSCERGPRVPRYGLVLMQLQVFVVYWQTVFVKMGNPYWRNGEFLTYFVMSHHGRFAGTWALGWHETFDKLTYLTLLVELAIPVLLWIPALRAWGLALGVALHLGIGLLGTGLWMFSATMLMGYCAFIDFGRKTRNPGL